MEYREIVKNSFVLVGFSAAGNWSGEFVYPIPGLWKKSYEKYSKSGTNRIVGVCLPPRSDHYFYTCGMEIDSVDFNKIEEDMTVHTFPTQKYVVFTHIGPAKAIPNTYGEIWKVFDQEGYSIKAGMPEIEIVELNMFGKEEDDDYEMEIWIPVQF
jgi:AraC family transcriptional regulator